MNYLSKFDFKRIANREFEIKAIQFQRPDKVTLLILLKYKDGDVGVIWH